jgi:hypothetical protein
VYGYKTQATQFGAQAGLYQAEAAQAPVAGLIAGGSTLLSGFGGLASKWADWQRQNSGGGNGLWDLPS